jgi:hypothetical protein
MYWALICPCAAANSDDNEIVDGYEYDDTNDGDEDSDDKAMNS